VNLIHLCKERNLFSASFIKPRTETNLGSEKNLQKLDMQPSRNGQKHKNVPRKGILYYIRRAARVQRHRNFVTLILYAWNIDKKQSLACKPIIVWLHLCWKLSMEKQEAKPVSAAINRKANIGTA